MTAPNSVETFFSPAGSAAGSLPASRSSADARAGDSGGGSAAVKGRDGVVITRAKERTANCQQCCSRTFIIYDGSEQELYRLKAGQCTSDSGNCNACAPSCCVNAYEVDMYLAGDEGKKIDTSAFLFPGCCTCAGATDRSNFVVKFPVEATTHQRAALLGGMFLVEYTIMELKRQQEKENNNQGGGGGAPEQQQMAR